MAHTKDSYIRQTNKIKNNGGTLNYNGRQLFSFQPGVAHLQSCVKCPIFCLLTDFETGCSCWYPSTVLVKVPTWSIGLEDLLLKAFETANYSVTGSDLRISVSLCSRWQVLRVSR